MPNFRSEVKVLKLNIISTFYLNGIYLLQEYKMAAEKIRKFYFNGKPIEYNTLANLNQLMADIKFVYGINLNARIQAGQSTGRTYVSR